MVSKQHENVECFADLLIDFIRKLDATHQYWLSSAPSRTVDESQRKSHLNMALNFREQAFEARNAMKVSAPRVVNSITPPPSQTAKQFVASIMDNVESVWHLFRFVHCVSPDDMSDELEDPESTILENGLRVKIPTLRNELWESWRHLIHIIDLTVHDDQSAMSLEATPDAAGSYSTNSDNEVPVASTCTSQTPFEPKLRGRKKADYETIQTETQLAADWVRARDSGVYKVDFAKEHKMRQKDFDKLLDRVAKRKKHSE